MKSRRIRISSIVLKVFLAVLIVVEIYPIFWILTSSLKTQSEFVTQPSYTLPSSFQYENYERFAGKPNRCWLRPPPNR